jgi:putative secretion ATPase (PEP-CTERM system associated)
MYERFYNLRERPFALSPDPEYLYPSRVHQEALDYLRYGLETQAGFIVITGEIGSGKTTLMQTLLRNVDSHTAVGRIVNTMLEPRELLETIMLDFGLDPAGRSKALLLRDLSQFLVDQRLGGRMVLLAIDEAQNLSLAALEELRMLSNLETEKSKLVQIAMVGQPNLRDKLAAPELEQLRQRITVSYHLPPIDIEETANYINHRLRRAALGAPLEFPREATDLIYGRSRGVPRIINVICDAALVFGYAEERRVFDAATIREVLAELETTGVLPILNRVDDSGPAMVVEPGMSRVQTASANAVPRLRPAASAAAVGPSTVGASIGGAPGISAPVVSAPPLRPVPAPAGTAPVHSAALRTAVTTAALDERETRIRQREQELAEQRRVLAEEYRLLRAQRQTPLDRSPVGIADRGRVRPNTAGAASARFQSPTEGFWTRLKRFMLGVSTS